MAHGLNELSTMDATAQAELVRRRELTPIELVDASIARIESVNPATNAVISPLFEEARAAAISRELPSGPFGGVPFLLKDAGAMQKGQPYYMGNRALRDVDYRSPSDTVLLPRVMNPALRRMNWAKNHANSGSGCWRELLLGKSIHNVRVRWQQRPSCLSHWGSELKNPFRRLCLTMSRDSACNPLGCRECVRSLCCWASC